MSGEEEVRARSGSMGAGALETEASASQEGDHLKANKAMAGFVSSPVTKTAGEEAQPAGADEKRKELVKMGKETSESEVGDRGLKEKEASASEACDHGLKRKEASPPDFGILEKKRLMIDFKALLKSHTAEGEEEAQPAEPRKKKRTKVVKKAVPRGAIEVMRTMPIKRIELPDEDLPYSSLGAIIYSEWTNARADYEQALVKQYDFQGCAVDETDVTDDEGN